MPTDKILEFSLSRLKESVDKTTQKNERLAFENEMLRHSIYDLQQERGFLSGKKDVLSQGLSASDYEKKRLEFIEQVQGGFRERRTYELISIFQQDIMQLRKEIHALEAGLDGEKFDARQRDLSRKAREGAKEVAWAEKKLKSLEQKNKNPKGKVRILQVAQGELVQEIEKLQYGFHKF